MKFSLPKFNMTKFGIGAVVILGVILIFVSIILYIIFNMKSRNLRGKQLTSGIINLEQTQTPTIQDSEFPPNKVGREYSFAFWIYIHEYPQTSTQNSSGTQIPLDKMIFYRGNTINTANPIVFMDGLSNKMFIALKTENTSLTSNSRINYNNNPYFIRFMNYFKNPDLKLRDPNAPDVSSINQYIILTIDYIPLQRWVHIAFVVDNKIATTFVDSEIYSVQSSDEYISTREKELDARGNEIKVNKIIDKSTGTLIISPNKTSAIKGDLARLNYFNYAISTKEIKNLYNKGPVANRLAGMVIPYGMRNPFYRL